MFPSRACQALFSPDVNVHNVISQSMAVHIGRTHDADKEHFKLQLSFFSVIGRQSYLKVMSKLALRVI